MSATILKLGGSVITDKDRAETLDGPGLERSAAAIASAIGDGALEDGLVIVHGGGSFGHHHASEHGVTTTEGTDEIGPAMDIHGAMETLNRFVLSRLHEQDVPAIPVHPFSAAHRDGSGTLYLPTGQIETMLEEGFVPVLYGDLVANTGAGATIVSGDELVTELARALEANRIGLCSTVPGVLDDDEEVVDRITSFEDVDSILGESESTDVTGGMAGKVRTLLELDAPASIFGLESIDAFLAGEAVGTNIE
ncbi:isopentenyl phosphate kinase [Halostagnicola sp. A-GB9-2]|uniref:isopentenyl phosphate kinase n=1 Tax=Halostagnicola sp. A-GB9-2 TaxID=3048066 RepID=UPI0024BFA64C|nr:isopentenyl phosphate kinase [Halostagnicola sp. A-GB9-2]MDJ1431816.1 isopentenyl phosphate kinase [Halostagnicola sp. A-GB9-2]